MGGLVIRAFWGAPFGFVAHAGMRLRLDARAVAARYDVLVADAAADKARRLLGAAA